jgi:putative ABC transport system permease protein
VRTVILASMRTYARRYVAALLAVIIATGFIVAINALSAAAREGSGAVVEQQYGQADLAVTDVGSAAVTDRVARAASTDPAVTAVATNWSAYVDATLPDGRRDISLGSVATSPALRWQKAQTGRLPRSADEIALSSSQARKHGVRVGSTVTLDLRDGGERSLTMTGTVLSSTGPLSATGYVTEKALAGLGDVGYPTDVVLAVDGDPRAVASHLKDAVGSGSVVDGPVYREKLRLDATRGIDVFQRLIFVFAGISMFVGALVIANTFTILLAQRSRDLALLRCVGALRSQVARSVLIEGTAIGAIGAAIGVLMGLGVALLGSTAIRHWAPATAMGTPSLTLAAVMIPVLLGVAVTLAGSYLPARRAGAQSPLSALQPQDAVDLRTRSGVVRLLAAGALLVVGVAGLVTGRQGALLIGMLGGMLSFVGVLLLAPVLVPATIRCVGPLARRLGLAGRLAHLNSLRNPRRTAATATALLIGVTLITAVVVGSASISSKVNTSLDVNNPVDLIASTSTGTIPDRVVDEVRRVDGVQAAAALPGTAARIGSQDLTVLAVDRATLGLVHGSPAYGDLGPDEIVLPLGLDVAPAGGADDTVQVTIAGQTRTMRVFQAVGVGDAPLVSRSTLESMGATIGDARSVWVRAATTSDPGDLSSDVTAIAETAGLDVTGGLLDRADILRILDVVMAVTIGLLAIAVLIALIGVGNTLSLSVLERVRENSLLRALGLSRSGLRTMLAIEALLMAGVAAVLGVALGTAYAWFGVDAVSHEVFANAPGLTIPWDRIGLILLVAAAAGLAACVLPARRAARISPAAGLVAD